MQATYNAIAGDVPLLLAALAIGATVAIVGSYLAGLVADALHRMVYRIDHRVSVQRDRRRRQYSDERADRLHRVASAIDRTAIRWPLIALYWRVRTIRHRRRVQRRIDKFGR